jgi:hypothetical protein
MRWFPILFPLFLASQMLQARTWRPAVGDAAIEADFAGMNGETVRLRQANGRELTTTLKSLCAEDQRYARAAALAWQGAQQIGPQSLEVQVAVEGGGIARLALPRPKPDSPLVFGGEFIYLLDAPGAAPLERGFRLELRPLYLAGARRYQALGAEPVLVRALAQSLDQAAEEQLLTLDQQPLPEPALLLEPIVEEQRRLAVALPLGRGWYLAAAQGLAHAKRLQLHEEGKDHPASLMLEHPACGLALLRSALEREPIGLLPRTPSQLGQEVRLLALEPSPNGRDLREPLLTRGIISDWQPSSIRHDALLPEGFVMAVVLNAAWEPLALQWPNAKVGAEPTRLQSCVPLSLLGAWSAQWPQTKPTPPLPRQGDWGKSAAQASEALQQAAVLLQIISEQRRLPPMPETNANGPGMPAGGAGGAGGAQGTGFSLSSTGIRHNARCKYYNTRKPCNANDGKACRICGG